MYGKIARNSHQEGEDKSMEEHRCKVVASAVEDLRCRLLLDSAPTVAEDPRCKYLHRRVEIEVEDSRCNSVAMEMEDPRCMGLSLKW
jgi:hypothetical protein